MFLAGVPVHGDLVLELARMVDNPDLADRLETAYSRDTHMLGLTVEERETMLRSLDDPPTGLTELRAVLMQEHVGRLRGDVA